MGLFGNDGTVTTTFAAKDRMTPVVRGIRGQMDSFKRDAIKGFGLGAGLSVFSLAEQGLGMVADALMDGVRAAIEDEKATARLTQTIKANVSAWDGSTAAVDAAIKSAARLAFADDDVRAGLNQLIPRTKDIAEANRLLALSMDLARAKGMRLEDAATLVGKAYSGQTSALRRAGIAIKNTKNSTAALAELQTVVAGQAETYAATTEGSFAALDIQVKELNETIGYLLLPTVSELARFANENLTPAIDNIAQHSNELETAFHFLTEAAFAPLLPLKVTAEELSKHADDIVSVVEDMTGQVHDELQTFQVPTPGQVRFFDPIVASAEESARAIIRPLRKVPAKVEQSLDPLAGIVKGSVQEARKQAERDMADLQWALTHPMQDKKLRQVWKGELHDAYTALHKAQNQGNAIAIAKAKALIRSLKAKIKELDGLTFSLTGEFHIGKKGAAQLRTYFAGLGAGITGHTASRGGIYKVPGHNAIGGMASGRRLVGEYGPEIINLGAAKAHVQTAQASRGGQAAIVIDGHVLGRWMDRWMGRQLELA